MSQARQPGSNGNQVLELVAKACQPVGRGRTGIIAWSEGSPRLPRPNIPAAGSSHQLSPGCHITGNDHPPPSLSITWNLPHHGTEGDVKARRRLTLRSSVCKIPHLLMHRRQEWLPLAPETHHHIVSRSVMGESRGAGRLQSYRPNYMCLLCSHRAAQSGKDRDWWTSMSPCLQVILLLPSPIHYMPERDLTKALYGNMQLCCAEPAHVATVTTCGLWAIKGAEMGL